MKKTIWFVFIIWTAIGCSTSPTVTPKPTARPPVATEIVQLSNEPTVVKATRTPWPTLVPPEETAEPMDTPAPTEVVPTLVPTAVPTRPTATPTLKTICNLGGNSFVTVGNYLGPTEYSAELQIGGWQCNIPAQTRGYVQLPPGTYGWSARIPARGSFRNVQGSITVGTGTSSNGIILCLVDERLATAPQCPGGNDSSRTVDPAPTPPPAPPTATPVVPK